MFGNKDKTDNEKKAIEYNRFRNNQGVSKNSFGGYEDTVSKHTNSYTKAYISYATKNASMAEHNSFQNRMDSALDPAKYYYTINNGFKYDSATVYSPQESMQSYNQLQDMHKGVKGYSPSEDAYYYKTFYGYLKPSGLFTDEEIASLYLTSQQEALGNSRTRSKARMSENIQSEGNTLTDNNSSNMSTIMPEENYGAMSATPLGSILKNTGGQLNLLAFSTVYGFNQLDSPYTKGTEQDYKFKQAQKLAEAQFDVTPEMAADYTRFCHDQRTGFTGFLANSFDNTLNTVTKTLETGASVVALIPITTDLVTNRSQVGEDFKSWGTQVSDIWDTRGYSYGGIQNFLYLTPDARASKSYNFIDTHFAANLALNIFADPTMWIPYFGEIRGASLFAKSARSAESGLKAAEAAGVTKDLKVASELSRNFTKTQMARKSGLIKQIQKRSFKKMTALPTELKNNANFDIIAQAESLGVKGEEALYMANFIDDKTTVSKIITEGLSESEATKLKVQIFNDMFDVKNMNTQAAKLFYSIFDQTISLSSPYEFMSGMNKYMYDVGVKMEKHGVERLLAGYEITADEMISIYDGTKKWSLASKSRDWVRKFTDPSKAMSDIETALINSHTGINTALVDSQNVLSVHSATIAKAINEAKLSPSSLDAISIVARDIEDSGLNYHNANNIIRAVDSGESLLLNNEVFKTLGNSLNSIKMSDDVIADLITKDKYFKTLSKNNLFDLNMDNKAAILADGVTQVGEYYTMDFKSTKKTLDKIKKANRDLYDELTYTYKNIIMHDFFPKYGKSGIADETIYTRVMNKQLDSFSEIAKGGLYFTDSKAATNFKKIVNMKLTQKKLSKLPFVTEVTDGSDVIRVTAQSEHVDNIFDEINALYGESEIVPQSDNMRIQINESLRRYNVKNNLIMNDDITLKREMAGVSDIIKNADSKLSSSLISLSDEMDNVFERFSVGYVKQAIGYGNIGKKSGTLYEYIIDGADINKLNAQKRYGLFESLDMNHDLRIPSSGGKMKKLSKKHISEIEDTIKQVINNDVLYDEFHKALNSTMHSVNSYLSELTKAAFMEHPEPMVVAGKLKQRAPRLMESYKSTTAGRIEKAIVDDYEKGFARSPHDTNILKTQTPELRKYLSKMRIKSAQSETKAAKNKAKMKSSDELYDTADVESSVTYDTQSLKIGSKRTNRAPIHIINADMRDRLGIKKAYETSPVNYFSNASTEINTLATTEAITRDFLQLLVREVPARAKKSIHYKYLNYSDVNSLLSNNMTLRGDVMKEIKNKFPTLKSGGRVAIKQNDLEILQRHYKMTALVTDPIKAEKMYKEMTSFMKFSALFGVFKPQMYAGAPSMLYGLEGMDTYSSVKYFKKVLSVEEGLLKALSTDDKMMEVYTKMLSLGDHKKVGSTYSMRESYIKSADVAKTISKDKIQLLSDYNKYNVINSSRSRPLKRFIDLSTKAGRDKLKSSNLEHNPMSMADMMSQKLKNTKYGKYTVPNMDIFDKMAIARSWFLLDNPKVMERIAKSRKFKTTGASTFESRATIANKIAQDETGVGEGLSMHTTGMRGYVNKGTFFPSFIFRSFPKMLLNYMCNPSSAMKLINTLRVFDKAHQADGQSNYMIANMSLSDRFALSTGIKLPNAKHSLGFNMYTPLDMFSTIGNGIEAESMFSSMFGYMNPLLLAPIELMRGVEMDDFGKNLEDNSPAVLMHKAFSSGQYGVGTYQMFNYLMTEMGGQLGNMAMQIFDLSQGRDKYGNKVVSPFTPDYQIYLQSRISSELGFDPYKKLTVDDIPIVSSIFNNNNNLYMQPLKQVNTFMNNLVYNNENMSAIFNAPGGYKFKKQLIQTGNMSTRIRTLYNIMLLQNSPSGSADARERVLNNPKKVNELAAKYLMEVKKEKAINAINDNIQF